MVLGPLGRFSVSISTKKGRVLDSFLRHRRYLFRLSGRWVREVVDGELVEVTGRHRTYMEKGRRRVV